MSKIHEYSKADSTDLPVDNHLRGLADLLDPRKFQDLFESRVISLLGRVRHPQINYIRYKPGTNCLVAYKLTIDNTQERRTKEIVLYAKVYTPRDFENAQRKIEKIRWLQVDEMPSVIPLPEQHSILYCYPNDCLIDGLKILADSKKIQRLLYDHYPKFPRAEWRISDSRMKLTLVRYKPERRAVLRCDTRAVNRRTGEKQALSVFIRAYGDMRGKDTFAIQQRLYHLAESSQVFSVPMPILYLPNQSLFFMETADGQDLLDLLGQDDSCLIHVAEAIAELHDSDDCDLPTRTLDSILADALATSLVIRHITPELAEQTVRIIADLTSHGKRQGQVKLGFVHGDFYYGQVMIQNSKTVLLDFDRSYFGDSIADIGNFCAHLRCLGLEGRLDNHARLEELFIGAYQNRIREKLDKQLWRFHLAHGLFQLSVGPFRRLEPGWRQKIKAILDECQRILQE